MMVGCEQCKAKEATVILSYGNGFMALCDNCRSDITKRTARLMPGATVSIFSLDDVQLPDINRIREEIAKMYPVASVSEVKAVSKPDSVPLIRRMRYLIEDCVWRLLVVVYAIWYRIRKA